MKILVLSTDDNLGAGKAALRITKALNHGGNIAKLLVKNKTIIDSDVISLPLSITFRIKRAILDFAEKKILKNPIKTDDKYYFFGFRNYDTHPKVIIDAIGFMPDLIIITWISNFISPRSIFNLADMTKANVIAYPLDMSLFTGGCHYAWECEGYLNECRNCPAILTYKKKNISQKILKDKIKFFNKAKVKVVAATSSLLNEARKSTLFKDQNLIPKVMIPIDAFIFNSNCREFAKSIFNIELQSITILFGASFSYEERKGVTFFLESLNILNSILNVELASRINIIIVGHRNNNELLSLIPFKVVFIDYIKDDMLLSLLYQASDVFVSTSIQDTGPMMINESLMCGTPVIAFKIGVAEDLIHNNKTGYRVDVGNSENLAKAMFRILTVQNHLCNKEISEWAKLQTGKDAFNNCFIKSLENI